MEPRLAALPAGKEYGYAYRAPAVRLADPRRVFAERAMRFARLAAGHPLGGFLSFMAALPRAQQAAADALPPITLPMEEQLRQCYQHGLPPRSFQNGFQTWGGQVWGQSKKRESTRESTWQHALQFIVSSLDRPDLPEQTRAAIQRLEQTKAEALERWADALLRGALPNAERALAPFLAAALQVYWVKLASALDAEALSPREDSPICPVCGSPPVAGIVRMGGDVHALRYLSCPLCATEWHMVRIKCSHCLSTQGIAYHSIEGDKGAVKGETCSNSHFDDFTLFLAAGERVRSYAA